MPLPPDGSILVTVRKDRDSLGAMAVLILRAEGRRVDCWLVQWLGLVDGFGFNKAREMRGDLKPDGREPDAIQVIINDPRASWPTMEDKVAAIADILAGEMPRQEIDQIASLKDRSLMDFQAELCGKVAVIMAPGKYNQARNWGNKHYQVALVFDPIYRPATNGGTRERWTLVRQEGCFDRQGFEDAVNAATAKVQGVSIEELKENGYSSGGTHCIVSESQRTSSGLTREMVIAFAREHAESGIFS
jgi:hypothetical protein